MKPLNRKTELPTPVNRVRLYTAVTSIGFGVILMSGQGQARLKDLANSIISPTFPEKAQNQYKRGCHLLNEHSTIELHHRHGHAKAPDLDSLQSWLESAYLQVNHPDHRDDHSDSNNPQCQG